MWDIWLMLLCAVVQATGSTNAQSTLTNVALYKPAAQSTSSPSFPTLTAAKAVDGGHSTDLFDCQHTADTDENDDNPTRWWLVDLQGFYGISSVQITNRGDCCADRLRDFDIQVFTVNPMNIIAARVHTCYHYNGPMGSGVTELLQCGQPIIGRYVRIIMSSNGLPLHMCEVEVMARTPDIVSRIYIRTPGNKAAGDMIGEVTSRSVNGCLMWCNSDVSCSAVNMGPKTWTSAGWSATCQLLSFGGIGQPDSTTPEPDWNFYSMKDL